MEISGVNTAPQQAPDIPDWPPLVIAVAPNGATRGKADHPALPITPAEIAETAAACVDAGAAMLHLHVRDRDGRHTLDADAYNDAIQAVRGAVGERVVIQATSEAVGMYRPAEQMAMVRAVRPEAVSMAIRELVPDAEHEREAGAFFEWLLNERIAPQYILYTDDEVRRFADLRRRGVIPGDAPFVLYVLGRYTQGQISAPADLLPFLGAAGSEAVHWGFFAFGPREGACAMMVTALGGHARVGFENNRWLNNGELAPDNAALVRKVADGAELINRPLADADTARALLVEPVRKTMREAMA
ncbi:MAG: 3-keto-5-aminohexanoate cleavage protein [Magnetovibrio sp.]|nr:3-keto-5-aminohexanoate cleavage protein [Magnetovibrio sp.]